MVFLSHKPRILVHIFTKKASFYLESKGELLELPKCQNKLSSRGLESTDKFRANWAQMAYQAVSTKP